MKGDDENMQRIKEFLLRCIAYAMILIPLLAVMYINANLL